MARRRRRPEQIIPKLRDADRLLAKGADVADLARHLEVSEQTYHWWRNQHRGMNADDAKQLRDLERDDGALKRTVADKELENVALRKIAKGNWQARRGGAGQWTCSKNVSVCRRRACQIVGQHRSIQRTGSSGPTRDRGEWPPAWRPAWSTYRGCWQPAPFGGHQRTGPCARSVRSV
jgi:putative transposase